MPHWLTVLIKLLLLGSRCGAFSSGGINLFIFWLKHFDSAQYIQTVFVANPQIAVNELDGSDVRRTVWLVAFDCPVVLDLHARSHTDAIGVLLFNNVRGAPCSAAFRTHDGGQIGGLVGEGGFATDAPQPESLATTSKYASTIGDGHFQQTGLALNIIEGVADAAIFSAMAVHGASKRACDGIVIGSNQVDIAATLKGNLFRVNQLQSINAPGEEKLVGHCKQAIAAHADAPYPSGKSGLVSFRKDGGHDAHRRAIFPLQ